MKIIRQGRIFGGHMDNWHVKIQDDKMNTGGYLVFYSSNSGYTDELYDDWFETLYEAEQNFKYNNYSIMWEEIPLRGR